MANTKQKSPPHAPHGPGGRTPARLAFLAVLATLAGLTLLALVLVIGEMIRAPRQTSGSGSRATVSDPSLAAVVPAPLWIKPEPNATLTRIGFGSCLDQVKPQPIWRAVLARKPELFLMIGDNVYARDVATADARELIDAYRVQARHPELADARAAFPFLATWDDHDYGMNDAGAGFAQKARAAEIFRAFWQLPEARGEDGGIYYSRVFGAPGRRVQLIMLDTRSFRASFKPRDATFPYWGKYQPDATPGKTMLGERQWQWLTAELKRPAEIRLVISSIQVLAEGHGFERWGNLPAERKRLLDTVRETGAGGVLLLTGDRHNAARYEQAIERADGRRQLVVEMTASSMNRSYGPAKDARMAPLASDIYHPENFAMIDIDWAARTVALTLHALDGRPVIARTIDFDEIAVAD